jgi:short-subunit dehydrogenase
MTSSKRILILGATSAIAQAYARRRASEHPMFILAGRNVERLNAIAADLTACGAAAANCVEIDLADTDKIAEAADDLIKRYGNPDEVMIAYGVLGKQANDERDIEAARAAIEVNFTSPALWILALLKNRRPDESCTIIAIGSVAGDRGRASNFIYGSAKGGLERLLEGLAQEYASSGVRIITIKPGFVDTPMTDGLNKGGPLWATPDRVAADIVRAVKRGRRVVYTPWFWKPIMMIIRYLPWVLFKRLKI